MRAVLLGLYKRKELKTWVKYKSLIISGDFLDIAIMCYKSQFRKTQEIEIGYYIWGTRQISINISVRVHGIVIKFLRAPPPLQPIHCQP